MNVSTGKVAGKRRVVCRYSGHSNNWVPCPNSTLTDQLDPDTDYISITSATAGVGAHIALCLDCAQRLFEDLERARDEILNLNLPDDEGEFDDE